MKKIFKKISGRLKGGEARVGNYIVKDMEDRVVIEDIGGLVSHSVSKNIAKGLFLKGAYDRREDANFMEVYSALMMNVLSAVPDPQYIDDLCRVTNECIERHPELYGLDPAVTPEKDAEILADEKEKVEVDEILKEKLK